MDLGTLSTTQPTVTPQPSLTIDEDVTRTTPGVNPNDAIALEGLTDINIRTALDALKARAQIGVAGIDLQRQGLRSQFERSLITLGRGKEQAVLDARNEAGRRGVLRSGIRIANEEEALRNFGEAEAFLREDFAFGQGALGLQIEDILAQLGIDSTQATTDLSLADLDMINGLIGQFGLSVPFNLGAAVAATQAGGEAPDNILNRNNPTYTARATFVEGLVPQILSQFGVSSLGQWRAVEDAGGAGRSPNSDHLSGGAADFTGSQTQMAALAAWARQQPFVSFVRFGDAAHQDNVHISFKLGVSGADTTTVTPENVGVGGGGLPEPGEGGPI